MPLERAPTHGLPLRAPTPLARLARPLFTQGSVKHFTHAPLLAGAIAVLALTAPVSGDTIAPVSGDATAPVSGDATTEEIAAVHQIRMNALDGTPVDFDRYRGKVLLVVNVASKCGFTPQYQGLQALHERFAERGLTVVGVPSNDFGEQEPGTSDEIATFCRKNYGVSFDLMSKSPVVGDDKAPLYQWLTSQQTDPETQGEVKWNFEKFLIARDGSLAARFGSRTKPEDPALVAAIEAELAKPAAR